MNRLIRNLALILIGYFFFVNNSLAADDFFLKNSQHYFLIDIDTDEVLIAKNPDQKISPSSMTKLMTAYVVFDQIDKGLVKIDDICLIGRDAWNKSGSTMFLSYGDIVSIEDLLKGLLVMSGNDSAIALAQATVLGGYDEFIKKMNFQAAKIGMNNSYFINPHGLHEDGHYSSLRDMAKLITRIYQEFPQYSHFLEIEEYRYNNYKQNSRNPLVKNRYEATVIGGKTGYTMVGGYGAASLVKKDGRRLVAVVNNSPSLEHRSQVITSLVDYGFKNFKRINLYKNSDIIATVPTWLGRERKVGLVVNQGIFFNVPSDTDPKDIEVQIRYQSPIYAPIKYGSKIAILEIKVKDQKSLEFPLYSAKTVGKLSFRELAAQFFSENIFKEIYYYGHQIINAASASAPI